MAFKMKQPGNGADDDFIPGDAQPPSRFRPRHGRGNERGSVHAAVDRRILLALPDAGRERLVAHGVGDADNPVRQGSRLLFEQARIIAQLCAAESGEAFVKNAYLRVLTRLPNVRECSASLAFLENTTPSAAPLLAQEKEPLIASATDPAARRREQFVQVLLNHTDFITIR